MNGMITTEKLTPAEKAAAVREYQTQTIGTDQWYKHTRGMSYTDGIRFVAETCGAYWLLDMIESHQINPKVRAESRQFWQLEGPSETRKCWRATAWTDTPHKSAHIVHQDFEYSDFPVDLLPFDLWLLDGVLILPEEY